MIIYNTIWSITTIKFILKIIITTTFQIMSSKDKDRFLSKKLQGLALSPNPQPVLRKDFSMQLLDLQDKKVSHTNQDIKIFNHKKDYIKNQFRKDLNDSDRISQSSYMTRTIKEFQGKGSGHEYDYEFTRSPKNEAGMNHYRSGGFLKKHMSPSTAKLTQIVSPNQQAERQFKTTIESLQVQNSRLHFENSGLQNRLNKYLEKIQLAEMHGVRLEEQLEETRMSYERLMHEYRQLAMIHEDSIDKQRELGDKVEMLTDKNFKLQELLYNNADMAEGQFSERQHEDNDQIQQILLKTQQSIDQYVLQLDSLRELINEKEQAETKLQIRIQELELELKYKQDAKPQDKGEISRLNTIIETQIQIEEALEQKIERLLRSNCEKCGYERGSVSQSMQNISTSESLKI